MRIEIQNILEAVHAEVDLATTKHRPLNSAHEAYAVILEELDELWDEIKKKRELRDPERMRDEAVQVAAMCVRFILDVTRGSTSAQSGRWTQ